MDRILTLVVVALVIVTGFMIWGFGQRSRECRELGQGYQLHVDGSYERCVNSSGEVREL